MKKLEILIILVSLLLFGCDNLQNNNISENSGYTIFKSEIEDLCEINDIKNVFNAWRIDYANSDLPNNLPHTMKITYVISVSEGNGLVYFFILIHIKK